MRKIFITLLLLLFIPTQFVLAKEEVEIASPTAAIESVDYTLPYPGLLPDHPLYNLKVLRDRITGFFISDPLKKAEFDFLQADKRVNSAISLFAKGEEKYALAESTLSKGLNYFEQTLKETRLAKEEGQRVEDTLTKMEIALRKYDEVITSFKEKTKGDSRVPFENDLKRNQKLQEELKRFRSQQ